jgi:hypothetical protein
MSQEKNAPTLEQVKEAQNAFIYQFMNDAYEVNGCWISEVGNDKNAPADEVNHLCLYVHLRKPLPEGLTIPSEYRGVRVFIGGVGEIRAL